MKYTKEQIAHFSHKLGSMPPIEKRKDHTKQEAVKLLIKDIKLLQKRGYTLDQIAETLRGVGLSISTPTLRSCIQRARPSKTSAKKAEDIAAQVNLVAKPGGVKTGTFAQA